jgi:hypothetical protein
MGLVAWFESMLSRSARPEALYRRAVKKAKGHDLEGAIRDYTVVIEGESTSAPLKAMSLLNRAVAQAASRHFAEARKDLQSALTAKNAPPEVAAAARAKLDRIGRIEHLEKHARRVAHR